MTVMDDDTVLKLERHGFDVAIVDSTFFAKCGYLIPHRLQIPWITHSFAVDPFAVRVPWLPSFVPNTMATSLSLSDDMTFTERLKNTVFSLFVSFKTTTCYMENIEHCVLHEMMSRTVLWLVGVGDILDFPRPMMPNMVSIAGHMAKSSSGKLPPDIQHFIDGAAKGVILMTFGSLASSMPTHTTEKFFSAFRQLDGYRVIWRLNKKDNVQLPDNVMTGHWLPQNDILAHSSVKLFITHAGVNGHFEAIYHGVPMIAFPIFSNHHYYARRVDLKGYGMSMNLHEFTVNELLENIYKILGDTSFKKRVTKASEIFRSQAQSPLEKATFWIEHVCQFGGDHLRSAGDDLPLYSYLMLDVLAFVLLLLLILVYFLYVIVKFMVNKCRRHKTS